MLKHNGNHYGSGVHSPGLVFVHMAIEASRHLSYQPWQASMHRALELAIDIGMSFDLEDFAVLSGKSEEHPLFPTGSWASLDSFEHFYTRALTPKRGHRQNISAARSMEHMAGRKPMIYLGKRLHRNREIVGWYTSASNRSLVVTGFDDAQGTVRLCSSGGGGKVRRFALDHGQVKAWNKWAKATKKAKGRAPNTSELREYFIDNFGRW